MFIQFLQIFLSLQAGGQYCTGHAREMISHLDLKLETEVVAYSPPTDSILKKLPHDWIRDCTSASVSGLEA